MSISTAQLVAERDRGRAVLLVSLELDEVMSLSDRILVMYEGEIVGGTGSQADHRAGAGPIYGRGKADGQEREGGEGRVSVKYPNLVQIYTGEGDEAP